jgi:hypothetical protein
VRRRHPELTTASGKAFRAAVEGRVNYVKAVLDE